MGFKDILIGIVLTGLFAIAIISFGGQLGTDNPHSGQNIKDNPFISNFSSSLEKNLSVVKDKTQSQRESFETQDRQAGAEDFGLSSVPSIIFSFWGIGLSTFTLLINSLSQVLPVSALVINIIFAAIIITLALLGWRVIKAGGT